STPLPHSPSSCLLVFLYRSFHYSPQPQYEKRIPPPRAIPSFARSERTQRDDFMATEKTPRVLIVGGGFAGLAAARALARAPVKVTIIDRRNHHVFQPLLYQVATASLSPADISAPIRSVLRKVKNCQVVLAEIAGVDVEKKRLLVRDGYVEYDYLILAAGATHSYFGNDQWAPIAPGLKSVEDATELRRRILLAFEAAEYEGSESAR